MAKQYDNEDRIEFAVLTVLLAAAAGALAWLTDYALSYGAHHHCLGQVLLSIAAGILAGPGGLLLARKVLSR